MPYTCLVLRFMRPLRLAPSCPQGARVIEALVLLLDHGNSEVVYSVCGTLINFTMDAGRKGVLAGLGGGARLVEVLSRTVAQVGRQGRGVLGPDLLSARGKRQRYRGGLRWAGGGVRRWGRSRELIDEP